MSSLIRRLALLLLFASSSFAQVAYQLSPVAHQQFFDANGIPLSGGFVYTYASGSVTPLVTYKDNAGTANTNPIVLDAGGYATMYLGQSSYKFCVQNSSAVQQYCQDNIQNFQQVILSSANTWSANNFWTSGHLLEGTLLGFSAAGVTTADAGISRTAADTLACGNGTQGDVSCTLKLAKLNNGADLSLPTSPDTLVGKATTDTLTNKTLTSPTITGPTTTGTDSGAETMVNKTLTTPTMTGPKVDRLFSTGSAPGIAVTGFGAAPTVAIDAGSTDSLGSVLVTAGAGPAATGTIVLTLSASVTMGPGCVWQLASGSAAWTAGATWLTTAISTTATTLTWTNGASTALVNASTYRAVWVCGLK
jgi:hypothetical protein